MIRFALSIFLFFSSLLTYAQQVTVYGKVTDADSKRYLAGVTVYSGSNGTVTDSLGCFSLTAQSDVLKRFGVTMTHIGYQKLMIPYSTSTNTYHAELQAKYTELAEVKVWGSGLNILTRAIDAIPQNYPDKPSQLTGFIRLQYLRNASDYFNSDAIIQLYTPSVHNKKSYMVRVIQNRIDTISDKSLVFIKWIGGYLSPVHANIVHNNEPFINKRKIKDYRFQMMGKTIYHHRPSFVINFSRNDSTSTQKATGGTLFIDTATYAIAGADISYYNLTRYGTLPKSKLLYHVRYGQINGKWYLQESFMKGNTIYKQESPTTIAAYYTTKVDTIGISPFFYRDIVQEEDVTQLISKPGDPSKLLEIDYALQQTERYPELVKIPQLETVRIKNVVNNKKGSNWLNYFTQDNFRYTLSFMKFPLKLSESISGKSQFVAYGFQIGTYFRVYKGLFFDFEGSGNTGTDRTVLSLYAFHLSYDIEVISEGHSLTLSPFAGYDLLSVNEKRQNLKDHANYFVYGLKGAFELTHHVYLFAEAGKSNFSLKSNNYLQPTNFKPAIGILIKR
ncbi:carboxypeptidase-like protein [Mucilaginibacter oryzae]|uniref:Carboxypeptidase-like protein n=1 Tax=Mucilaginibacter oryzae TaxID=468058 RepID=A0A316H8E3_9SPHI|nr:carboxypeptidase-like regulatory domain-containing protein [Mucilaginibacter oryzae]PWK77264.1 carboxypeptidase-like protein [Mucilaginibacter oryzae]